MKSTAIGVGLFLFAAFGRYNAEKQWRAWKARAHIVPPEYRDSHESAEQAMLYGGLALSLVCAALGIRLLW